MVVILTPIVLMVVGIPGLLRSISVFRNLFRIPNLVLGVALSCREVGFCECFFCLGVHGFCVFFMTGTLEM